MDIGTAKPAAHELAAVPHHLIDIRDPLHAYNAADKTMTVVKGSGGLSTGPSELEGQYAWGWARNIWADSLA